jgi:hypothetical protein
MRRSLVPASGACALWRMLTNVPLLGVLRTSAVIGACCVAGGYPRHATDRPRPSFRRRPAKGVAFQKTRMPLTATTREGFYVRGGIAPSGLRAGSPAHAARTLSPRREDGVLDGHCKGTVRSPACPCAREYRRLFCPPGLPRLGLTTQARRRTRPTRPSTGTVCPARTGVDRSA